MKIIALRDLVADLFQQLIMMIKIKLQPKIKIIRAIQIKIMITREAPLAFSQADVTTIMVTAEAFHLEQSLPSLLYLY
ncbi:hypothetical protein [Clostridium chauvoei]|uniref:hypothetical protein n=1 Tax=Clostridium chauvoei TaxID=46867 RepID=UPI00137483E6|nr:hypothetical protein [Clostridium chauvoei]